MPTLIRANTYLTEYDCPDLSLTRRSDWAMWLSELPPILGYNPAEAVNAERLRLTAGWFSQIDSQSREIACLEIPNFCNALFGFATN